MTLDVSASTLVLRLTVLFLVALVSSTSAQLAPPPARSGHTLRVLVPSKPSFKEVVECGGDSTTVQGFSIDVFKSALEILIPKPTWKTVKYKCFNISDTNNYSTMVKELHNPQKEFDAVVGDITISASRLEIANFTQPYLDSGIVVVTPAKSVSQNFPGVLFFVPFTMQTWVVIIASIPLTGLTLWLLECDGNRCLQRSESRSEKFIHVFWFVTSILVFFKRESITNPIAKIVMIAWIFFIILLGSSYNASLSSILTVDKLSSESLSITDLANGNLSVGYQSGSIVHDYLKRWQNMSSLVQLSGADEYAEALQNKTVVAIVDEIPYISLFLASQSDSNCKYTVSSKLTIEGIGFGFYDKTLAAAFSVAILNLSESGKLQRLQDGWKVNKYQCPSQIQSKNLNLKSSQGLFVILGTALLLAIVIYVLKHSVFPCCAWTSARMRASPRLDAVDHFWEPTFVVSIRRFTTSHNILREELARS